MATKVGEGYIEITPKLVGFNRELLRTARAQIRDIEAASKEAQTSITVKPKIAGITKIWQREIQQELNSKITGLTVDVKVKLDNGLKVTFQDFAIEAKDVGEKAGDGLTKGFNKYIGNITKEINKASIAIKSGLTLPKDTETQKTIDDLALGFRDLSHDIDNYSAKDVKAINTAMNSHRALNNLFDNESKKAVSEYEKSLERAIQATHKMAEKVTANRFDHNTNPVWGLVKELDNEIKDAEKIADSLFPDLNQKIAQQGTKSGKSFTSSFGRAFKSNLFDNLSEGILSIGAQFITAAVSAQPLLTALANLAGGMIDLGTVAVDLYGSFLALPAVWAAVAQAGGVLALAFNGVEDALTAVLNEQQHADQNAAASAKAIANAQEQVANAKERLARTVESANASIAASEKALEAAQVAAAKRIAAAQDAIGEAQQAAAEAVESANERIADAQKNLSRAYEDAADRVASAEARHVDSLKRVKDAQLDLNQAYADAKERFEDLNIALGNGVLDEEGAQIAIDRAKERLDKTLADNGSTDLDKREAQHDYEEALQRLDEIQEKNRDIAKEIEEANRSGVEGSKEVTDAKQRLLDAQQDEIDAQADIAKAHKDAADSIIDAQERVTDAQADAVKAQQDGLKRIQDAEQALADARSEAAQSVQDAQDNLVKAQSDAAQSIADSQKDIAKALDGVKQAQEDQTAQWFNAQYALDQLSPAAQKFVLYLSDTFIPKLKEVQFSIQEAFFPPIQSALEKSGGLLELFQGKLTTTSGIFGDLIGKTIEWLNTPETINTLGSILDTNNRLFTVLGDAGLHFGNALLNVADSAGPFLEDMAKLVDDFAKWVDKITSSKDGREELDQFFKNVSQTIHEVWDITKKVGDILYEVYKKARPYGQDLLKDIGGIVDKFDKWVHSAEGSKEIDDFLKNGKKFLEEILKLIEAVGKAFFELGANGDMSGVVKSVRDDLLPALLRIIDAFGGGSDGGGFIFFIKASTVVLNTMAGSVSLLAALISGLGAIFTGDWSGARDSFADFLDTVKGNAEAVFGESLPANFDEAGQAFNDSVRGMHDDGSSLSDNYKDLRGQTEQWSYTTTDLTGKTAKDFEDMTSKVKDHTKQYADDVDAKTKDAKDKAGQNSTGLSDDVLKQMERMRFENSTKMGDYAKTVDQKTSEAKQSSNRNILDLVQDSANIMVPFAGIFGKAAADGVVALKQGGDWWAAGQAVINGLWEGVKSLIPNLLTSVWNLGVDIINQINAALGINSPSKRMKETGIGVGEGLVLGIDSMGEKVGRASKKLAATVTDSFGSPLLSVDVGSMSGKAVPTVGADGISGVSGSARTVNNVTVYAAPTVPTEKQISNILKQQEALYG